LSLPQVTSFSRGAFAGIFTWMPVFIVAIVIVNVVLPEIGALPIAIFVCFGILRLFLGSTTIVMDRDGFKYKSYAGARRYRWSEIRDLKMQAPVGGGGGAKRVAFTVSGQSSAPEGGASWGELGRVEILPVMNESAAQVFQLMRAYQALGQAGAQAASRDGRDFRSIEDRTNQPASISRPWGEPSARSQPSTTRAQDIVAAKMKAALATRKSQASPERKANVLSNKQDKPVALVREGGWSWFRPDRSKTLGY